MTPFTRLTAVTVPLLRANIDTDAIIPSREMKHVAKTGLADGLFAGWRYTVIGGRTPDPSFVLNQPSYVGARILLGGENFGCGSSREHAVWALHEYGFRAVVAPSFNSIFRGNGVRNGLLPVVLPAAAIACLAAAIEPAPATMPLTIDLEAQTVTAPDGQRYEFAIDAEARAMLLDGLDAIDLTFKNRAAITAWTAGDRAARPWIYLEAAEARP